MRCWTRHVPSVARTRKLRIELTDQDSAVLLQSLGHCILDSECAKYLPADQRHNEHTRDSLAVISADRAYGFDGDTLGSVDVGSEERTLLRSSRLRARLGTASVKCGSGPMQLERDDVSVARSCTLSACGRICVSKV